MDILLRVLGVMVLFDSIENWPLLSDENKWRANEGVRKGSVVNFIAQLPSCGGCATQCVGACGGIAVWCLYCGTCGGNTVVWCLW